MKFNDVKFKIKEFESVDIISDYSLAFYLPKEEHMMGEENKNKNQKTKKDEYRINKSNSLEYIQKINEEFDKLKDDALPAKEYKRKNYEYDVFYDVYTSKDNINKCIKKSR